MGRERGGGGRVGVRGRGTARSNGGRRAAAGPAALCFFLSLFSPCTRSFARHAFLVARAHGARLGNWQQSRAIVARGGQAGVHARAKGTETADAPPPLFCCCRMLGQPSHNAPCGRAPQGALHGPHAWQRKRRISYGRVRTAFCSVRACGPFRPPHTEKRVQPLAFRSPSSPSNLIVFLDFSFRLSHPLHGPLIPYPRLPPANSPAPCSAP